MLVAIVAKRSKCIVQILVNNRLFDQDSNDLTDFDSLVTNFILHGGDVLQNRRLHSLPLLCFFQGDVIEAVSKLLELVLD